MRKYIFFSILFFTAMLLSGCEDYHPSNAPRGTVTNKPNILTTVTTVETTRADTYSEYISSLKEAGADNGYSDGREHSPNIGGIPRDTAVTPAVTETAVSTAESIPRETAATRINVIIVTTVPVSKSETVETTETAVCTPPETEAVTTTAPFQFDFSLDDIPSIPSDAVKADTAVTNP